MLIITFSLFVRSDNMASKSHFAKDIKERMKHLKNDEDILSINSLFNNVEVKINENSHRHSSIKAYSTIPKYIFPLSKCLFVGINFVLTLIPWLALIILTQFGLGNYPASINWYYLLIPYIF